jgi:hypothetical protein
MNLNGPIARYSFLTLIGFLLLFMDLSAQTPAPTTDIFKLGLYSPGLSYEKKTGKNQTVLVNPHFSPYLSFFYSSSLGNSTDFRLEPALTLHYRFYYGGKKRAAKGKFTDRNSMDYIAPVYLLVFSKRRLSSSHYEENSLRPIHSFAISWGLQRNYNNRFSIDFNFGPGIATAGITEPDANGTPVKGQYTYFTLLTEARIGFWLNKRNKQLVAK